MKLPMPLIKETASQFSLDPKLVAALITKESSGQQYATRYEPNYKWIDPKIVKVYAAKLVISPETEEIHQKTSWGLGQVMGGVARELGFTDHLPKLTRRDVGLYYCCKKLKSCIDRYVDVRKALSAYNRGTPVMVDGKFLNQQYVDDVMALWDKFQKEM